MRVKVLWWQFKDGSGAGVERVYIDNDDQAKGDLEMLMMHSTANWFLDDISVFGRAGR
jgi:hypothetical protein